MSNTIDMRGNLLAPEGHLLAAVDLAQIEPRVLNWLAGNHTLLRQIENGFPIYEAHARDSMGWTGGSLKKEDPKSYSLAKARMLGLGYGCGWEKFITVAKLLAGLDLTESDEGTALRLSIDSNVVEIDGVKCFRRPDPRTGNVVLEKVYGCYSREVVADFRAKNPLIVDLWNRMNDALADAANREEDLVIDLPSSRALVYRKVKREYRTFKDKETGESQRRVVFTAEADGIRKMTYGAKIVENITQSIARDVFAHNMLKLVDDGIWVLWSVHDEAVCAVKTPEEGEKARKTMASTPPWIPGLPVEAELTLSDRYKK